MSEASINTYSDRRKIREEIQQSDAEGFSVDPAIKCKCSCGNVHYRKRDETNAETPEREKRQGDIS